MNTLSGQRYALPRETTQSCSIAVSKLSFGCLKVVPWLSQSCPVVVSKLSNGCLKFVSTLSEIWLKDLPKSCCRKAIQKLSDLKDFKENKMGWAPLHDFNVLCKFCNLNVWKLQLRAMISLKIYAWEQKILWISLKKEYQFFTWISPQSGIPSHLPKIIRTKLLSV